MCRRRKKTYHLNIIDGNVDIPDMIDIEYESLEDACEILSRFVHSYDGTGIQVDGRVVDADGEDVDYSSSLPDYDD